MVLSLKKVLAYAQEQGFAVGAFNVFNLELVQAVIGAAEAMRAPVIVQTSEKAIAYAGLTELAALVLARAKQSPIPVVFHLDHGQTDEIISACLEAGYTSVMFDGSPLPYRENVERTKAVVARAHAKGVSVEAELGRVGGAEDAVKAKVELTDPVLAGDFVNQTHCDALAVAIGNRHGPPQEEETLDLDRLTQIGQFVALPLVLHGASSTPEAMIKEAIARGITKINIDTDLRRAFAEAERNVLKKNQDLYDPREILAPARSAIEEVVKEKIALFGSAHKAKEII